jgi:hypothetical protein
MRILALIAASSIIVASAPGQSPRATRDPALDGFLPRPERIQFSLTLSQLKPANTISVDPSGSGLLIDLGDTTLYGRIFSGQAYFDQALTDYPETRYRFGGDIVRGKGVIPVRSYFDERSRSNANQWLDRGVVGYRLDLLRVQSGRPVHAGLYDSRVHFEKRDSLFFPIVSIINPPMIALVCSDHPDWAVVTFTADRPCTGVIEVESLGRFTDNVVGERHELKVTGLQPSRAYRYRALVVTGAETAATPWLTFRSAPRKGEGEVVFAYAGDGRAASGGGEYEYTGTNRAVGSQIAKQVFRKNASFLLFGGDMVAGYTNSPEELQMELLAFRDTYGPLFHRSPLYGAVGNHEALLNMFRDSSGREVSMDKWPYETYSTEAVVASMLVQPANSPRAGEGRPPYDETVYAFHYGPVKVIVMNNNYWFTSHNRIPQYGGSPEGYILPEQVAWIKEELRKGEADPDVKYIVALAQEPFFPNGGHVKDAMWHDGDNTRRAYGLRDGAMVPLGPGLIEVRNEIWKLFSNSRKVAAVLGSDEHNYYRMLVDKTTPVGVPASDDLDGNGKLDDGRFSPESAFRYPTWFMVSGGAGAPYYTQEAAPWTGNVKFFSASCNFLLFRATSKKIGVEVYTHTGQLLDQVENLMQVRR